MQTRKTQLGVFGMPVQTAQLQILPREASKCLLLTSSSKPQGDVWFSKAPLGHNLLGKIVSGIMTEAGYDRHYTNHSLRVSLATRLFDAEVNKELIMSRTGHSNTDGMHAYKRASNKLKQLTSDKLNNTRNATTTWKFEVSQELEQQEVGSNLMWQKSSVRNPPIQSAHARKTSWPLHSISLKAPT